MIVQGAPGMGFSELVELYGEEMGRSFLARQASKVKKVAKVVARNPAAVATGGLSLVAPKSVQKTLNRAVNKTAGAVVRNPAAVATGGLSLLAPKSIQKKLNSAVRISSTGGASLLLSKQDRNLASKAARPVAHVAAQVARNPAVRKLATAAARTTAAYYTGGTSELALNAAKKARSKAKPFAALARTAAPKSMKPKTLPLPAAIPAAAPYMRRDSAPAPAEAAAPSSPFGGLPILPIAIGGAGLLGLLLVMGKKK